jgi:hypothetical protein
MSMSSASAAPDQVRPSKKTAMALAVKLAPQYAEALCELQGRRGGRLEFPEELRRLIDWSGPLVPLYENEQQLNAVLALGVMGEQGFREWAQELGALTPDEGMEYLDGLIAQPPMNEEEFDSGFYELASPKTEAEKLKASEVLAACFQRKELLSISN